jgi:Asp-tRNA(Asn)/Glu-tRNA(Gln) amidotransferase A subunit family amidase
MSLPCGEDHQRLPIGLHLMAPQFGDEKLLSVAHAFTNSFGMERV